MDNELANTSTGAAFGGISVRKARQCLTFIWTDAARRLSRAALFAALAIATTTIHAFTVTPANGANGSISPAVPQTVAAGASISFTVTANAGFIATVSGTCGGQLADLRKFAN